METLNYIWDIILDGWWILLIVGVMSVVLGFMKQDEHEYESLEEWYHPRPLENEINKTEKHDK